MEVAATAPISALVPAIVEELKLPQTDLFGNKLVYLLRYPSGGPVLPDDWSLKASGVDSGARLALDSYTMEGSVATLMQDRQAHTQPSFYSAQTIADSMSLPASGKDTSGSFPAVGQRRKRRRWTRRAFLMLGGAVLGAGSLGFGYAAYHSLVTNSTALTTTKQSMMHLTVKAQPTTQPIIPTAATSMLVFSQHQQAVRSVSWSTDGKMLASGANDAQLLIWDLNGNVHVQKQLADAVRATAWSPDGQQLSVGAANLVMFLNPLTGNALAQPVPTHMAAVTTVAWSSRQPLQLISGGLDKRAGVWNAENGQQVHGLFVDAQLPMRALSFAASGGQLAVGGDDGIVRLWNGLVCQKQVQAGFGSQCLDMPQRLHAHRGSVRTLAWSPDARFLATGGDDGELAIWYPAQRQTPLLKVHHNAPVLALAWAANGKQVATASGNTVMIWRLS